jgi:uncharacterized delta-60 repeat protein
MITIKDRLRSSSAMLRLFAILALITLVVQSNLNSSVLAGLGPPPDGSLDSAFGAGGKVTSSFSNGDGINAIAIQQDGKIVAAGEATSQQLHSEFVVGRYNPNGTLDTSFGTGGRVITVVNGFDDEIHAVAIQPDGKIVVAGSTTLQSGANHFALARYTSNGALDVGFGAGGIVDTGFSGQDFASGIAIQHDGKIVAAGTADSGNGGTSTFALARYNSNGTLDLGFGSGGKATPKAPIGDSAGAAAVAIQSDGKIVAAGNLVDAQGGSAFEVARFNTDGSLDQGFGQVATSFNGHDFGNTVAIQADGKIVAAGTTQPQNTQRFALARYNTNGTLDSGFGSGGKVTTVFDGGAVGNAIAIQADGKLVVAGTEEVPNSQNLLFALARYNTNGTLDARFGPSGGGQLTTSFTNVDGAQAVAIQADGKIVAAGFAQGRFALARFTSIAFDTCMINPAGTVVFSWNSKTGAYSLNACNGFTLTGTGTIRQVGSVLTLTDFKPDRRLSVAFLTNQLTARATIYILVAPGVWQLYSFSNTPGVNCNCSAS